MPNTIVIIGAGQAGGWAAATLRSEGFEGRIVLIGDEPHPPHERPPLSKKVLAGEATAASTHLMPAEEFAALDVDLRTPIRASAIDRVNKQVTLEDGEKITYDRLILTTGGRARTLPVPGADLPGALTLRTLADAEALGERLTQGRRIIVIGGGWIGLEVAATARAAGCEVVVLEAQDRLCQRAVPAELSEFLHHLHSEHGVEIRMGVSVEGIHGSGEALEVDLGGERLRADTVVIGVGLEPNGELAEAAGLTCDRGVVVADDTTTDDPYIFAAGDVTVSPNTWAGGPTRLESWQNAQDQGIAAAKAALGSPVKHDPLPYFWSDQYDVTVQIHGVPQPHHEKVIRGDLASNSFVIFFLDGDHVHAAMGANSPKEIRIAKRIIERGIVVDRAVLADPGTPLPRK